MTLPLNRDPATNAQNSISMSQVNVELFFDSNVPISLNDIKVRNLFQKSTNLSQISLGDGFGKSNIGKPKNPIFTNITQTTATVSWGASDGICNKYTITVKDAATDTIIYGPVQNFTTIPLALTANLTGLVAATHFSVHLLASNTAITPLPTAETIVDLLTLENVPLTPLVPTATVISKNILRVTGSATYATSYDIYEVISSIDTVVATSVQLPYDHAVGTYTLHTYKIKGRSTGGVSPISPAAVPIRSLPDFPVPATNINYGVIANITATSIAVNWTLSTSPIIINQRVRVVLHNDQSEIDNSGLKGPAVTSYTTTTALTPATQYDVYVDTINEAGTATSAAFLFTTKTAQPAAPSSVTATSQTSITVTWGVTTGATSYILYKDNVSMGTQTSPFIDNTGITSYTLHSYQIAAVNAGGESVKSTATTERSFPDMPVAVTNIVVTPDMNSFAVSWTAAETTSTRTVDGYKIYVYLTSDMSLKYDSGAYITGTSKTTDSVLSGWTNYTIRIYTYNRAGSIFVDTTATTLADLRPDPLSASLVTITGQEPSATNVVGAQVTIGTFQPNYNSPGIVISTSSGSFQAGTSSLTTGWVTTATVIPDSLGNIVFQPRRDASTSETTTVTTTYNIGGGTRTFSVTTRDPNPPTGVSSIGSIGTATVTWTNLGYTYIVTASSGQSKTVSNVGSVVLGDSAATRLSGNTTFYVYARNALNGTSAATSTTAYVTPMPLFTYNRSVSSVNEGSSASFSISTTNVADNSAYNWSISGTGVTAADFSAMSYTDTSGAVTSMTPALTGSFKVYSSVATVYFTIAVDHLTEGAETITFQLTGSPTGDFSNSNISMVINDTSLDPDLSPNSISFSAQSNVSLSQTYTSGEVTVTGLEPSWPITVSASGGSVYAGTSSASTGPFSTATTIYTDSSGQLRVNAQVTSSSSYLNTTSVTVYVGSGSGVFSVSTTSNESVSVTAMVDQGNNATISMSGGYSSGGYSVSRISSTGSITDSSNFTTGNLNGSGSTSISITAANWGTCQFSIYFYNSGHTRTTGTLMVNPNEVLSVSYSSGTITVSISNCWPSETFNTSVSGSGTMNTYDIAWGTKQVSSGTYSKSASVGADKYGTWTVTVTFITSAHTRSQSVTVPKSAPNVIPSVTGSSLSVNSIGITFSIGTSTAGPIEGVTIYSPTAGTKTLAMSSGSGLITFTGLTDYTSYSFQLATYNSDSTGTYSSPAVTYRTLIDDTPNSISFTAVTGANPSAYYYSNEVTVTGLSANASINVYISLSPYPSYPNLFYVGTSSGSTPSSQNTSGSPLSVTTSSSGTLYAKVGAAIPDYSTTVFPTLYIGSGSGQFNLSTRAPVLTPNAFSFTAVTGANASAYTESTQITITGLEPSYAVPVSVSGNGGVICNGTTVTGSANITTNSSGQMTAKAYVTSSSSWNTAVSTTLTIGSQSSTFTVTTLNVKPSDPTSVSAGSISSSGFTVNWTAPASGGPPNGGVPTYYSLILYSYPGLTPLRFDSANYPATSFSYSGLTRATQYYYGVAAVNSAGASTNVSGSNDPVTTLANVPGAPTIGTATAGSAGTYSATVTWTAPTDNGGATIDYYVIYVNGTASAFQSSGSPTTVGVLDGLVFGSNSFKVAAHNSAGIGTQSATSNSVTVLKGAPGSTITVNSRTATRTTIAVNFSITAGSLGSPLEGVKIVGTGISGSVACSTAGTYTVTATGLTASTAYTFGLAAYNSDAQGSTQGSGTKSTTA